MCDVCHYSTCPPGCPGYEPPDAIYTCKHCGEGIVEGEEYIEHNNEYYHADCISDMTACDIAELFGLQIEEAYIDG